MAQSLVESVQDPSSNEISVSTNEFLHFEQTCEGYKDDDDEIKLIFKEINKLSGCKTDNPLLEEEMEDVELILQRAEVIALESQNLLKSSPIADILAQDKANNNDGAKIPQIKVTKPEEMEIKNTHQTKAEKSSPDSKQKVHQTPKHGNKDNSKETVRHRAKVRPFSAGTVDSKKREAVKVARFASYSPKKTCKHDSLFEELKNTNERVKGLELINVQLNDDSRMLRKKLDQVNEAKHIAELKLSECEKFISRLGKEYENRNMEYKSVKENESRLMAELNKERNERKNLKVMHDKDVVVIHDLQRQCKEMEMILRRKHPDSVSALIVASKSSSVEDNKKKLLEERTSRLEQELKDKEDHFQSILLTLQEKFSDMKQKYENHIIDVERQLMEERRLNTELKNKINRTNLEDAYVQTSPVHLHSIHSQTLVKAERVSSAASRINKNSTLLLTKLKEDSYLCATIKGLQAELTVKQRTISKINRESEELKKNLRNLQKEKEVLINLNPQKKVVYKQNKSAENLLAKVNTEIEAELTEVRKQKESLARERDSVMESLKRSNEEFILLKKKRIQDLHTLQLAHEKELMQMNMQLYPLQEEIKLLNRTVEILQERVRNSEDKLARQQVGSNDVDVHAGGDNGCFRGRTKNSR